MIKLIFLIPLIPHFNEHGNKKIEKIKGII